MTPAWGFQFFIKSEFGHINRKIEQAILAADRAGTKVIGLGALNKNEALNGGGQKFVDEHPELGGVRLLRCGGTCPVGRQARARHCRVSPQPRVNI